jgi:hypothetical protein
MLCREGRRIVVWTTVKAVSTRWGGVEPGVYDWRAASRTSGTEQIVGNATCGSARDFIAPLNLRTVERHLELEQRRKAIMIYLGVKIPFEFATL